MGNKITKPEIITFEGLVEHGKTHGANIVNDMPWSFEYKGFPVSHENDDCYIVNTPTETIHVFPEDVIITGVKGNIHWLS